MKLDKTLPFDKQIEMSREYFEYMLELSRAEYEENFPFIEAQSPRYFVFPMTSMGYNKAASLPLTCLTFPAMHVVLMRIFV